MKEDVIKKIRAFNRYYTGVIGVTNNHILKSKYSLTEVRVMFEVYNHPNITAQQIKEIVQVDEGYLSRLITKLVKLHIVQKEKSKADNRELSLTLTKNGESVFLKLDNESSQEVAKLIGHLTTWEQEELILHLQRIQLLLTKKQSTNDHR